MGTKRKRRGPPPPPLAPGLQVFGDWLLEQGFSIAYLPPGDIYGREHGYHFEFPPGGSYSSDNRDKNWIRVVVPTGLLSPWSSSMKITEHVEGRGFDQSSQPYGHQRSLIRSLDVVDIQLASRNIEEMLAYYHQRLG